MQEVAGTREHHGDTGGIGRGYHLFIADGTTGLDAGGGAGIDSGLQAISKGEQTIGSNHAALEIKTSLTTRKAVKLIVDNAVAVAPKAE